MVSRNAFIAVAVLLAHGAALWALQSGLLRRAVEIIVPAEVLSDIITPPAPQFAPPPPRAMTPPAPPVQRPATAQTPAPKAPAPIAETLLAPAMSAAAPQAPATTPAAAPPATATPPATAASLKVELPSSDAQYLKNPPPAYPALSKRLGEQGKVVVRVLIGTDGTAQKAEIQQSSGFERLDQAALRTVQSWRYVPGKRGGVAEAMWFNVPIHFVLE